ncbi:DUF6197 family protein [Mycolicibacterium septicum]|uniref:DUF6197 family protein n=1 Tax=Mycolicibacterium septicum TaxID=98668 RepID=UPI001AF794A6|nr:hypothetical protein [Mycolicibacterium septicum]QRY51823.1 hypothetical protein JVX95_31365 [Mycolicibacterium septicum]
MSLIEFMKAARQRVENGWHQGSLTDFRGNVDAVGALYDDLSNMRATQNVRDGHELLNDAAFDRGYISVSHFNDDPQTSQQDVLDLYDDVIEGLS